MQATETSKLRRLLQLIGHFIVTVLFAAIVSSILQTQLILRHLPGFGLSVDWATRLSSTAADLQNFAPTLAALIAAAFMPAFASNALLSYLRKRSSIALTVLAGAIAVVAMLMIMRQILGLQPIASARDTLGLISFALCGGLAGGLFAWLRGHGGQDRVYR